jgi:hypothetical protein
MTVLLIRLNPMLHLKDPQSSDLGNKIISKSIEMIAELGFEAFTFKKLSVEIESTEASIYRYFENKHRLLNYLIAWYWTWLDYQIDFETNNILDTTVKLETALKIITIKTEKDESFPYINETALRQIVISESDKVYLTKQVDDDNKQGLFRGYKSLCNKIGKLVLDINPNYQFPNSLISTVLEASNQQIFFAEHLPSLSESSQSEDSYTHNYEFIKSLVFKAISA